MDVPVIAAGGIADARGIVAAFALGASAVQIGTAYLFTPEATHHAHAPRGARQAKDDGTALTNLFTGRPARGLVNRLMREAGPLSEVAPPSRRRAARSPRSRRRRKRPEAPISPSLWSGQAAALGREMGAGDLTRTLWAETLERLRMA